MAVTSTSAGRPGARGARAADDRGRRVRRVRGDRRRRPFGPRHPESRRHDQPGRRVGRRLTPPDRTARQGMIAAMTLAERLAVFAADLDVTHVPPAVIESVKLRVLDVLGIALAASTHEFAPSVLAALESWGSGECTLVAAKTGAPLPLAILANGTLAHGLDFDDTHAGSITHASAVVLPAALSTGEAERVTGRAVLAAAVVGYEAITRIGLAVPGAFHARGWHATSTCGVFAAALAVGKVMGLDAKRLASAVGLAGSFASGVMEYLTDGSWSKRVHAGWAGHGGAIAATLARGGFGGPATILEGRFGLYATMLGRAPDLAPFETLGREWETLAVGYKPFPCCHLLHAYLDCALALGGEHRLAPEAIAEVECRVPAGEVPIICEPRHAKLEPRTSYDAQFSLPYTVAAALVDGRVTLDTFAPDRLGDPRLLALAARVTHTIDPDSTFPDGFPGWVRVRLSDGRLLEAREPDGRGGPRRPLPPTAIVEKFRENASRVLAAARVDELEQAALGLDAIKDAGELMRLCRG
ncbi:MAG: MmgE/PrpD family protein [Candidatus Rokuibacteriota bacterium]|nr:MAG: MmgE/PrpD family protein [Candidatus Rokubacteria bacterium]